MATVSVDLIHRAGDDNDRSRSDDRNVVGTLLFAGAVIALLMAKPQPIELAADPRAIDFGAQQIGRSATQKVSFTNPSTHDFAGEGVTIASKSSDFAVASQCGRVAARQSCVVEVTFTPRTEGPQSATISLSGSPARVVVNGFGLPVGNVGPLVVHLLNASAKLLEFANVDGNSQGTQSVTFTNDGNDNVIVMPAITGENFTIANDECSAKKMLSPHEQCAITIASTATIAERSGALNIIGANEKIEASVALRAPATLVSIPPGTDNVNIVHRLTSSVKELAFVNIDGSYQGSQSVTFTNDGNDEVVVAPNIAGENFKIQKDECSEKKTLTPGDRCSVTISSQATGVVRNGTLNIIGANEKIEASVSLSAEARESPAPLPPPPPPGPRLRTDRKVVDFTQQKTTSEEANQISRILEKARCFQCRRSSFHIVNAGPGELNVARVVVDQSNDRFGVGQECSNTPIAEGAQCLVVVMWPDSTLGGNGRVRIDSNAATSPDFVDIAPLNQLTPKKQ
jgi:hypothetical protein